MSFPHLQYWAMRFLIFISSMIFLSINAKAVTPGWAWHGGVFQQNLMQLTDDEKAGSDFIGETYLPLGIKYTASISYEWFFAPALSFTHFTSLVYPKETPEKGATKEIIVLSLPFVTNLATWADGKFGIGYFQYEINGKGGTIDLNNGTGTSTFYQPSQNRKSKNIFLIAGLDVPMTDWNLGFDLIMNGALSDRRNYSLYINFSKPFGSTY